MDWKKKLTHYKYLYDISASFLGLINFFLLSITASVPIRDFLLSRMGFTVDQFLIVGILCTLLIVGFLLFGWILDKFKYYENLMDIQNSRNPQVQELLDNTRELLRKTK